MKGLWGYRPDYAVMGGIMSMMDTVRESNPEWFDDEGRLDPNKNHLAQHRMLEVLSEHFEMGFGMTGEDGTVPVVAGEQGSPN